MLKGRKADGEIDVEIPNTRRLYCVYIKNITYNIDVGSANYQIEGIRAGDLNNADDHSLVQKTALTGIETMDDFLNEFQKEVNKQERHKLGSTKAILDQYVFRIDSIEDSSLPLEDLSDSKIMPDKASKNNSQNQDLEGGVLAEIERNTSIKEVLERFMSRNEVMQNRISGITYMELEESLYLVYDNNCFKLELNRSPQKFIQEKDEDIIRYLMME